MNVRCVTLLSRCWRGAFGLALAALLAACGDGVSLCAGQAPGLTFSTGNCDTVNQPPPAQPARAASPSP